MSKKQEIELSPEQKALLDRVLASIRSGKRFSQAEYEEYIYLLRDISVGTALEKRIKGQANFVGDITAAERLNAIIKQYEESRKPEDGDETDKASYSQYTLIFANGETSVHEDDG